MNKDLTKTHRNAINKIRKQLILRQSMTYRQMILYKMLKRNVQYIAPFISINTTFDTLNNLTAGATL